MPKRHRIIGTTEEALVRAESHLGRPLPPSFRAWLKSNNGRSLEAVRICPVLDDRDPRMTWDCIVREYASWKDYSAYEIFQPRPAAFDALLPFALPGTGDYYCFDYAQVGSAGEPVVVLRSHENGESTPRGASFSDFARRLIAGEFEYD